jgi:predicted RNase H-like nuclease (RuvC/YqgF family)
MSDFFKLAEQGDYIDNQKYKVLFGNTPTEEIPNPKKQKYSAILLIKGTLIDCESEESKLIGSFTVNTTLKSTIQKTAPKIVLNASTEQKRIENQLLQLQSENSLLKQKLAESNFNSEQLEEKISELEKKINDNNKSNVCDWKTNGILNSFSIQICKLITILKKNRTMIEITYFLSLQTYSALLVHLMIWLM